MLAQGVAQTGFHDPKALRHAELHFEEPMVNAADFPQHHEIIYVRLTSGESGHAENHRQTSGISIGSF
jgi:hypothetical protein